jgi:hypothetical protein
VSDFLAHPLFLLLAGAVLTGLLIPALTRRWQNRQKALELKTELIGEISESITEMVMAVQFVHLGATSMDQQRFDEAYREWEARSAVIGTKLQAYFPKTAIPAEWNRLSEVVTDFYALEGVSDEKQRSENSLRINEKLFALLGSQYERAEDWGALKEGISMKKADIIRKVLDTRISVF